MKKRTSIVQDDFTVVYEDGVLDSEIPLGNGIARWYHKNGKVRAEVPKLKGETHGTARTWHDNGQLASETELIAGQICGIARNWNRDGSLASEMEYYTPLAVHAKNYGRRGVRQIFLWEGKPIAKTKWLEKVEGAGCEKSEVKRKLSRSREAILKIAL